MAVVLAVLLLILANTVPSSATYCICKDGVSESALQKDIDYACGNGASCSAIQEKGACYNPNTVKDHCNYAVNSYFQNKGQTAMSCDFSGTATTTQTLTSQSSTCVYPTSASSGGTPSTGTGTGTGTTTPSTGTNPPSTGFNTPTTGFTPGSPFGISPTGIPDNSRAATTTLHQTFHLFFWPLTLTLLLSGPIFLRL